MFSIVVFRRLERALNPMGVVSPNASVPRSEESRVNEC